MSLSSSIARGWYSGSSPPPADEPRRGLALLPPPSRLDVWFDMEGYPLDGGLEYLFGAATNGKGEDEYVDFWAHDAEGERKAFEAFVRWVTSAAAATRACTSTTTPRTSARRCAG